MPQISQFLIKTNRGISHYCPACNDGHYFAIDEPAPNGCQWKWDGNIVAPTCSPSMLIRWYDPKQKGKIVGICHYVLNDGRLQFLPDCTHKLSGLTVPLPHLPDFMRDKENLCLNI